MRLLLVHAQLGQQLEYDAGFYFKFPRQLVDPDFAHRRNCLNNSFTYFNLSLVTRFFNGIRLVVFPDVL